MSQFTHVRGLKLAPGSGSNSDISAVHVLIASDYYKKFFTSKVIRGAPGKPVTVETVFAWVLASSSGPGYRIRKEVPSWRIRAQRLSVLFDHPVIKSSALESHRSGQVEADASGFEPSVSESDAVYDSFLKTTTLIGNRYQVCLSWKTQQCHLTNNYGLAERCLQSFEKRFEREPRKLKWYWDAVL